MTTALSTIIGAIIAAAASIIVCVINNNRQNSKHDAVVSYRIDQLEKKVDLHNHLIDRMYKVEEQNSVQEQRISALERKAG